MTRLIALGLATLLFVTACSSGNVTTTSSSTEAAPASVATAPATTTPAAGLTITIGDFNCGDPLTVRPGATVTVVNSDGAEHTVTADSGSAFNAEVSGKGTTTFTAPTQPGNYAFHCTYHPMMHGRLTVQ
ncbi:MAG TPA: cupredoxin domain-containing protein [Mycobacterium sp.]|nr:MAG: plastocyanin [Mycobacterium sp.]HNF03840.1 cupredoxin domain-containing protein [Mycobacterium sp.]HRD13746.1 cupredoxin domain-containing protein [Mycobacterium sp.]